MKILCTGNPDKTEFKTIAHCVRDKYPEAMFISKTKGYDLIKPVWEQHFFKNIICEYDVFINSSYISGYQAELLQVCHDAWSEKNIAGHIINIGSTAEWLGVRTRYPSYTTNKRRLRDLSLSLSGVNNIKTTHIVLGGILDGKPTKFGDKAHERMIDIEDVVDLFGYILNFKYHLPLIQVQKDPNYGQIE